MYHIQPMYYARNQVRSAEHYSLRKTEGKVSPILVTLTPNSDSNFERSKISLKKYGLVFDVVMHSNKITGP